MFDVERGGASRASSPLGRTLAKPGPIALGVDLCNTCGQPAVPGIGRCDAHWDRDLDLASEHRRTLISCEQIGGPQC